jgi:hypothetical protein
MKAKPIFSDTRGPLTCVCGSRKGFYPCTRRGRILKLGEVPPEDGSFCRCIQCGQVGWLEVPTPKDYYREPTH